MKQLYIHVGLYLKESKRRVSYTAYSSILKKYNNLIFENNLNKKPFSCKSIYIFKKNLYIEFFDYF